VDAGFRVKNAPAISFGSSHIRDLLVQADGRILFAAALYPNSITNKLGRRLFLDRAVVGRLLSDGTWDDSFPLLTCALPLTQQPGPFWFNNPSNPSVVIRFPGGTIPEEEELPVPAVFLAGQPGGVLVLAGAFDSVNGEPRRRLARLDPDGALRGRLELNLSSDPSPQLNVPGEVEVPYFIDTSTDLKLWSPWLINDYPWWQLELPLPTNEPIRFFRARSAE
ncbi:MAG TPA: delta-60 repeat domain-containing protein, partial [Candidatus Binatia bacterium]|nr:delta-60 repeat domain-containing protein [Candidatus Binatia bacterium]